MQATIAHHAARFRRIFQIALALGVGAFLGGAGLVWVGVMNSRPSGDGFLSIVPTVFGVVLLLVGWRVTALVWRLKTSAAKMRAALEAHALNDAALRARKIN